MSAHAAPATTQSATDLPAPTRVTLKLQDTPVTDAFVQLFDEAGLPAAQALHPGFVAQFRGETITADFVDQPFLTVLLDLCRRCELEPQFTQDPARPISLSLRRSRRSISTRPARGTTGPATLVSTRATDQPLRPSWLDAPMLDLGPLLLVADSATRTSRADVENGGGVTQDLRLGFTLIRDPRLRLFGLADEIALDQARDDAGRSLLPDGGGNAPPGAAAAPPGAAAAPRGPTVAHPRTDAMLRFPLAASLQYPKNPTRTLALLRGRINATVVAASQPVEIVNKKGAVAGNLEAKSVHFTVGPLEDEGDGCRLSITITRPFGGAETWDDIRATARGDFFLATHPDAGPSAYRVEVQIHSVLSDRYEGMIRIRPAFRFQPNTPKPPRRPAKVVWDVPTDVTDVSIPIEFKDLPLP
jgi:hypothetical protein